jgi:MFS superfamily sulfate permease-like transporter
VVAAPVVTHVAVRRAPLLLSKAAILLLAVPQLLTLVILGWLDVWLEVHSGYLLDGSGEEAMAYGIGMMASTFLGGVIALFVFSAAAAADRRVRSTATA